MQKLFLLLIFGILFFGCTNQAPAEQATEGAQEQPAIQEQMQETEVMQNKTIEIVQANENSGSSQKISYQGEKIAGEITPYIRYNKADFDKASGKGKVVYLYFYANWCPICIAERPSIFAAFNKMNYEDVVGFEVHYNDDKTTDEDREIAKESNIAYQHTTIILGKDGKEYFRSLSPVAREDLIKKIEEARGQ